MTDSGSGRLRRLVRGAVAVESFFNGISSLGEVPCDSQCTTEVGGCRGRALDVTGCMEEVTSKNVRVNGFGCRAQLKLRISEVVPHLAPSILITDDPVQIAGTDESPNDFSDSPGCLPLPKPIVEVAPRLRFTYLIPSSVGDLLSQVAHGDQVVNTVPQFQIGDQFEGGLDPQGCVLVLVRPPNRSQDIRRFGMKPGSPVRRTPAPRPKFKR
ncbi:hypothetical protein ACFXPN_37320 [Streptomyces griseorubiginosus]|uniref:hypothetical protein n=1 Tax=Streptomyces griseorubiginosus TaxID=67304 RepID=UPI0036AC48BB